MGALVLHSWAKTTSKMDLLVGCSWGGKKKVRHLAWEPKSNGVLWTIIYTSIYHDSVEKLGSWPVFSVQRNVPGMSTHVNPGRHCGDSCAWRNPWSPTCGSLPRWDVANKMFARAPFSMLPRDNAPKFVCFRFWHVYEYIIWLYLIYIVFPDSISLCG